MSLDKQISEALTLLRSLDLEELQQNDYNKFCEILRALGVAVKSSGFDINNGDIQGGFEKAVDILLNPVSKNESGKKVKKPVYLSFSIMNPDELGKLDNKIIDLLKKRLRGKSDADDEAKKNRYEMTLGALFLEKIIAAEVKIKNEAIEKWKEDAEFNHAGNMTKLVLALKNGIAKFGGGIIGTITAVAFGLIETGVAAFFIGFALLALVGVTPVGWGLAALLGGSLAIGAVATKVNIRGLTPDVQGMLGKIFHKKGLFRGFLEYTDKDGNIKQFTPTEKRLFGAFTLGFALPTGIAIGALGYTSTLAIPAILAMFGVTIATSIFPPLGIAIAVFVAITMTLFNANFLYKVFCKPGNTIAEKFAYYFKEPYKEIGKAIDKWIDPKANEKLNSRTKKATYIITGIICAAGIVGLGFAALVGANSVTAFSTNILKLSGVVAGVIGLIVGATVSFVARFASTLTNVATGMVNVVKAIAGQREVDKMGVAETVVEVGSTALFYYFGLSQPATSTRIIPLPTDAKTAGTAIAFTTVRDTGFGLTGCFKKKDLATKHLAEFSVLKAENKAKSDSVNPGSNVEDENASLGAKPSVDMI